MSITPEALRLLHRLHQRQEELTNQLASGPKQVAYAQTLVDGAAVHVEEVKERTKKVKMASDEKQLQLNTNEARIEDWKSKLMGAASNKEYQTLKEQIAADEVANSVLSDEILELFDKVDQHEAEVKAAEENLDNIRCDLDGVTQRVSDEKVKSEAELAEVREQLVQAEKILPGDSREEYDRVVRKKAGDALAPLEGETCGSCYVNVTPQQANEVALCRVVFCSSCGSLLYKPESGGEG